MGKLPGGMPVLETMVDAGIGGMPVLETKGNTGSKNGAVCWHWKQGAPTAATRRYAGSGKQNSVLASEARMNAVTGNKRGPLVLATKQHAGTGNKAVNADTGNKLL
jgi:hypothetical protein